MVYPLEACWACKDQGGIPVGQETLNLILQSEGVTWLLEALGGGRILVSSLISVSYPVGIGELSNRQGHQIGA